MTTTTPPRPSSSFASFDSPRNSHESLSERQPVVFSPTATNKSAETNGTGATGSTELPGTATKSLIESVTRRRRAASPRDGELGNERATSRGQEQETDNDDDKSRSRGQGESWIEVGDSREEEGEEAGENEGGETRVKIEEEDALGEGALALQFPEPSVLFDPSILDKDEEGNDSSFVRHEESELFGGNARVTNSQEAEGLKRSVTRSQSDFTRWLEETMRLARGDGTSVIETDDALSSILQATRETRFGHSEYSSSVLGDPIALEDSLFFDGDLSFEQGSASTEGREAISGPITPTSEPEVTADVAEQTDSDGTNLSDPENSTSRNYGWKLLSLSLSLALAYSIQRQRGLSQSIRPTPSLRFIPIAPNNSTTIFSPFSTPLPVANSLGFPIYAVILTLLAALPTSLHLLFRRKDALPARMSSSSSASRASSPLLELNGDALLSARERLSLGASHLNARHYELAIASYLPILNLACPPLEKSLASEQLGWIYYFLARQNSNDAQLLNQARNAFERSIRLDSTRAGPRGGLGKTKYRLGDHFGAVKAFETAISRDDKLGWAFEWLAKSLYRITPGEGGRGGGGANQSRIENLLERAILLAPETSYQAQAFLGEILHLRGGGGARQTTERARQWLERSVSLRIDQPQVHARLGFIANERLDPVLAAKHFRLVLETRSQCRGGRGGGGRIDETCPASLQAVRGVAPHFSLYFVVPPTEKEERFRVLRRALLEYPHDDLLQLLDSIGRLLNDSAEEVELETRSERLRKRSERYPEDSFATGLYALSLLALGKVDRAEQVYSAFWNEIGGGRGGGVGRGHVRTGRSERQSGEAEEGDEELEDVQAREGEEKRRITWLVIAFFEMKHLRAARITTDTKTLEVETASPIKENKKAKVSRVVEVKPVRRSSRLRGE